MCQVLSSARMDVKISTVLNCSQGIQSGGVSYKQCGNYEKHGSTHAGDVNKTFGDLSRKLTSEEVHP